MINKLYEKLTKNIKENFTSIIILIVAFLIMLFPIPYYVYSSNGIMNVNKRIEIEDKYKSKGSFNLTYVNQFDANVITYLYSLINPNWDLIKKESKKDTEINNYYDHLALNEAVSNATIVSYKKANKDITINQYHFYIAYISEEANTDIQIKDEILKIDDIKIETMQDITDIVNKKQINDEIKLLVKNNNKEYIRTAKIYYDQKNLIGVGIIKNYEITTNPKMNLTFNSSESGPSGGLMMALEIYNQLTSTDITKGYKIAGTGTIDEIGNVGEVSGIKYKLKGAIDKKVDVFLVPKENYEEAIKLKEEHNYKIEVCAVKTFDEAIKNLQDLTI